MQINKSRLLSCAFAAAALSVSVGVRADLVYLPGEASLFQGAGLGAVNTVLTLGSSGSSSDEAGAVFADGIGFATSGDAFTGMSQVGLPTLGALGIESAMDLRIVLNATEPAGNSLTISSLRVSFYEASGTGFVAFQLASPVELASTLTGVGNAGFVFGLDAAQATAANSFFANSSTALADFRVGLSAALNDATGGPETFFVVDSAALVPSPVPEPSTWVLTLAGLGAIGFVVRQRRRR